MGSCFSKHTPRQRNPVHEVKHQNPAHQTQPWRGSSEHNLLSTNIPNTSPFPSSYTRNDQDSATSFVTSADMLPSPSPQVTSASSSPHSVHQSLHSASQTPLGKRPSSANIYNTGSVSRFKSSASPSTVFTRPSSPSAARKCIQRRDDENSVNNAFPSVARKQWLSQNEYSSFSRKGSAKDLRLAGDLETPAESMSNATSYNGFDRSQASTTISSAAVASRKSTTEFTSGKTSPAHDLRAVSYAASRKSSASRSLNLGHSSAPASRRNSISRDQHNTFEPPRENTRPSSPLKRHSSVKDHASVPGSPRLSRNNSSKGCSPNRNLASSRQDSKSRIHYRLSGGPHELSSGQFGIPVASGHRRYSSRDSVPEFSSSNNIRRPSPPKRTPVIVSTSSSLGPDFNKMSVKRSASASYQKTFAREDDIAANTSSRNVKKKESSYLNSANWTRIMDGSTDLSINSDTFSYTQLELKTSNRNKKPATRRPLKEISDNGRGINNTKSEFSRLSLKDATKKPQDNQQCIQSDTLSHSVREAADVYGNVDEDKDPLEVKAESLVMGGKSVLSAFKALEEYRLKYSNIDVLKTADEESWCMGPEDSIGEPMELDENQRPAEHQHYQQVSDMLISRSSVKSCEPFLFSDVESLISEKDGMQLEGMQIPPSITKACSILRAVADLNKGTSMHSRVGTQDEIGMPKLSSFSFME